ncbi:MAG: integrase [Afipia sp. 62-7]|nr:site-specific integrase [Afipia sp.]OJU19057.1 MAG: integrase [Afipia sp. 62-7]
MAARHEILGGKVQLYKRPDARFWQCSTSIGGKQHRSSTKKEELSQAEDAAEDWYLELRGKFKRGELGELVAVNAEKTFQDAAEQFLREFPIITEGQRNEIYVKGHERRLRNYLIPFMGKKPLSEVTGGLVQEYRIHRIEKSKEKWGKPPARSTMHQEIVALRQTLKTALRHRWLNAMPDISEAYKHNTKISHRAWFSLQEYQKLYKATRQRVKKPLNNKFRWDYEQLHDKVLFMTNTGLRPDEVGRLEYRDVSVVDDAASGETILEIEVRGKRGVGFCKSMPNAVPVFQRMKKRNKPKPSDRLFPSDHHVLFNTILDELDLKFDRDGQRRTFYSLRHTYVCFRLMEGADIYQIAKNCRTSVEMIEKFYASHLKNTLDASAINVRRAVPAKKDVQAVRRGELA